MRRSRCFPALIAVLVLVAGAPAARAQTSAADRQKQLQNQILEAGQQEAAALAELQAIRDRKGPIDAKVVELDAAVADVQGKLDPLVAEAARLAGEIGDLQVKLAAKQAEFDAAHVEFDGSAAQIYRSARRGATYDVVTAARPADLVQGARYLDQINQLQRKTLRHISELRDDLDAQRKALADRKAQADSAAADVQKLKDQAVWLRGEVEPARAEAARQAQAEESQLASIRSQKSSEERELAALQAVSDSIAAQLRNAGSGPGVAGACQARPVPGAIVSPYGARVDPISGAAGFHPGVDMAASYGTPIRACRAGIVVIAGPQGGYGNAVVISHGANMATLYGHQSSLAVSVGQTVSAGQVIGYVGSTGYSTGPHLHFEVRISGNTVDPVPYL